MNISNNTIKELLKSQGKLDFKPCICDGFNKEIWAYRTEDDSFFFCDNELNILEGLDLIDLRLGWGVKIILSNPNEYRIISEGFEISDNCVEGTNDYSQNEGWIIDCNDKITKRIPNFIGYKVIDNYYVFNASRPIYRISNGNENYWLPTDKAQCFIEEEGMLKETDTYYCGTYLKFNLFFCNDKFYIKADPNLPYENHYLYFDNPVFWFAHNTAQIIDIHKKDESYELSVYKLAVEKTSFNTYKGGLEKYQEDECECIGNYNLGIELAPDKYNYYADINFFLVRMSIKNRDFYLFTIDRYGSMWRTKESENDDFISYNNGIIKLKAQSKKDSIYSQLFINKIVYKFINYRGELLASLDEYTNFFVVSKVLDTTIIGANYYDNPQNEKLCFYGIINGMTGELVVPIKYDYLKLYDGFDYFYAIIKGHNTDENGEIREQYGLMYNGNMILPCNNSEIQVFNKNLYIINDGVKYKIISNGKICIEDNFDEILPDHKSGKKYLPTGKNSARLTNYDFYWAVILRDGLKGLFSPDWNLYIKPQFTTMTPLIEEKFLLADKKLYKIDGEHFSLVKDMSEYCYIGGFCQYHLFVLENGDRNCLDNYVCYHLNNAQLNEQLIENVRECYDINSEIFKHIDLWVYEPILCIGDIFYSIGKAIFEKSIDDFISYPSPDPDAGWNYERDTYYALGGSDYDRWKDEGGDLDSMMDGMGY